MVLRSVLRVTAIGLTVGVAGVFMLSRVLSSQFNAVRPNDPLPIAVAAAALAIVAMLAGLRPALRATSVDPLTALRQE
jgi:ABC-type antimicrobial peptide transport system permease subunit